MGGGSSPIVQYLLETGHKPGPYDKCTETSPLTEAIRCHRWQIAKLLLKAGADVNPPIAHDAKCSEFYNPSDWELNWYWDSPPPALEETPLSCAIKERNEALARLLIDRGALVAPQSPPTTGTPLLYAAKEGLVELVRELLSRGADANQQGTFISRGKPTLPIVLAAQHGNADVLKLLLEEYNGDINLRLLNGSRPIHSAASSGRVEQIKTLLAAGADIDSQNDDGMTPLHWAAEGGCWDAVELLLDRGAVTDIRADCTGVTALDLAQLARQEPDWKRRKNEGWDKERVDGLMERLKPRAKIP